MPEIIITLGENVVNRYVFEKDIVSIGRSRDNDIVIENLAISRNHSRIRQEGERFFISDLNSANGTFVNGVQITKTELHHNDVISVGKHRLIFKHEVLSDEALISDAFGAERTMVMQKVPTGCLRVVRGKQKDQEFRIDKAEVTIGRGKGCGICLQDWFAGKEHAVIVRRGDNYVLRDMGSWRGTKVNERSITEATLREGDEIQIGGTRMTFTIGQEETPVAPTKRAPSEAKRISPVPAPAAPAEPFLEGIEAEAVGAGAAQAAPVAEPTDFDGAPQRTPMDFLRQEAQIKGEALFEDLEAELRIEPPTDRVAVEPPKPAPAAPAPAAVRAEPAKERVAPPQPPPKPIAVAAAPAPPPAPAGVSLDEVRLWEDALKNKSPVIRKQAAKMLKKLTGRDYGE